MAASPAHQAPTPSASAGSPLSVATAQAPVPPLAMKPSPGPSSPVVPSPSGIVMQKEWVVPPRPKPGRKPAVDTPPTKRKAQNRAAQRAFRERRAARVGELEERIKEIEEEDATKTKEMEAQIVRLQHDVERFKGEVVAWKEKCAMLDQALEQERAGKERADSEQREAYRGTAGNSIPPPAPQNQQHGQDSNLPHQHSLPAPQEEEIELIGCGNCTKDSHCECVAQAINISYPVGDFSASSKRPHSPQAATADTTKRLRNSINSNPADLETDFTALYSSDRTTTQSNINSSADPGVPTTAKNTVMPTSLSPDRHDMCGFCQDGTPCVCAELSLAISLPETNTNNKPKRNPTLLPQFTPPPSDTDVTLPPLSLPPLQPPIGATALGSCANGPGTCAQCRADPNSTLFCKSLAAIRNNDDNTNTDGNNGNNVIPDPPPACCRGSPTAGGPCCRDPTNSNAVMLSCADTYQALSRHPGYELATDEFGSWLNRLNTCGTGAAAVAAGRPAMEVEAASVMGVLKLFDRRFGRG
ncbi:hypothetical protein FGG08_000586 [Glutinoglossum americanum]|uniref:BZIP domain-containing protein n=1 Tax=Glutinoglossum americanum TaxID=1670608 RepID=A0A9P8IG63_9PEZI|nr:hypothetical protein FGG08_000586 [Glutinoglossum americanum]